MKKFEAEVGCDSGSSAANLTAERQHSLANFVFSCP
jgi:hypothetical protein